MTAINSLDSLNGIFFSDESQRKFNLKRAAEFYSSFSKSLDFVPIRTLALGRSWLSEYLHEEGIGRVMFPIQLEAGDKFDLILGLDEVLTRDGDESSQRKHIMQILGLLSPGGILLASLRDFRNNDCHRRPLGDCAFNIADNNRYVTTEVNEPDARDKQAWRQKLHVVVNDSEFYCVDAGVRRTLYFKQLAKYCANSGTMSFGVFKDLHWKGNLRRTPEHVIYARATK